MKRTFLLLAIIALMLTSCKKCGDCMYPCKGFYFAISVRDKETGIDVTGDNLDDTNVKYLVDSVKYQVITKMDTSGILTPNITRSEFNTFDFSFEFSDYKINDATGLYYFIIHLNEHESDTVKISYQDGRTQYEIYQNDSLVGNPHCGFAPSLNFLK